MVRAILNWSPMVMLAVLGGMMLSVSQRSSTPSVPKTPMPTVATVIRKEQKPCTYDVQGSFVLRKNPALSQNVYQSHCLASITNPRFTLGEASEPVAPATDLKDFFDKANQVGEPKSFAERVNRHAQTGLPISPENGLVNQVETPNPKETISAEKTGTETDSADSPLPKKRGVYSLAKMLLVDTIWDFAKQCDVYFFYRLPRWDFGANVSWPGKPRPGNFSVGCRKSMGVASSNYIEVGAYLLTTANYDTLMATTTIDAKAISYKGAYEREFTQMDVGATCSLDRQKGRKRSEPDGPPYIHGGRGLAYVSVPMFGQNEQVLFSTTEVGHQLYEHKVVLKRFDYDSQTGSNGRAMRVQRRIQNQVNKDRPRKKLRVRSSCLVCCPF